MTGLVAVAEAVATHYDRDARAQRYRDDPVLWAWEYLGVQLWSKQKEILYSLRDNRNTAVAAAHGVGKSYVAGIAVGWWVDTHPLDEVFVASTAPTMDQVNIIWDNIRRVHALAKRRFEEGLVDHPLPGNVTGDNKWKLPDGTIIGQGRKPPDAKSDVAFQGRHATYLLAIGDEAVGLSSGFLGALGNIATGEFNRQLLLANPTDPSSAMAKIWSQNLESWVRMHISLFDSPAVTPEEDFDMSLAPALSGWDYINERREEWGEDDPRYIARVLGQWAFDAGNTVFTAEELARAKNTVVVPDPVWRREIGVDIARMGKDASLVYLRERGEVWETDPDTGKRLQGTGVEGVRIRKLAEWKKAPLVGKKDPDNPGSAERVDTILRTEDVLVAKVDASGIGSAVVDGLADLNDGTYLVFEVFGGAPASDKRAYTNLRAETFFDLKKDMHLGRVDLDGDDEELFDELSAIQFEITDKGPIKIESKEAIRKDGRKSPDHADALWYAYLDIDALLDDPYHLERGDKLLIDPSEYLFGAQYAYGAPGTPM